MTNLALFQMLKDTKLNDNLELSIDQKASTSSNLITEIDTLVGLVENKAMDFEVKFVIDYSKDNYHISLILKDTDEFNDKVLIFMDLDNKIINTHSSLYDFKEIANVFWIMYSRIASNYLDFITAGIYGRSTIYASSNNNSTSSGIKN
jgi:hypothetical protein